MQTRYGVRLFGKLGNSCSFSLTPFMHEIVDNTLFEEKQESTKGQFSQHLMRLHDDALQCNSDFLIRFLAAGRAEPPHRDYLR